MHWGEMDALGHANNARYFTWFETARMAYFERLALPETVAGGVGPVLASTHCDFLRPVVFPAELVVGASVAAVGTTSMTMRYAITRAGEPETTLATGSGVVVLFDHGAKRTVPLPQELRARIATIESVGAAPPGG